MPEKSTRRVEQIMGMPIQVEIKDSVIVPMEIDQVFDYFRKVDNDFSPFKDTSEVGKLNRGEAVSREMEEILKLAEELKKETKGYFDITRPDGTIDPSGIVKGLAIANASLMLKKFGYKHFFVDAGGDADIAGEFRWGIKNPFNTKEIVKVLNLKDCGIATSGTYERGKHIYNPLKKSFDIPNIVSLTVIGPNVYEADKFATPAFAMGRIGINFIEQRPGLEGYMIDKDGIAVMTRGFSKFVAEVPEMPV
jgi:thiamine biosynthesis lipoprotein